MDLRLRPRFSDTFALVGILLLVTSVPGYVAQDDDARDLSGGYQFKTGEVRLGATLELEAILQFKDRDPLVVGPTRTLLVRAAEPGEVPVPAAFVHEETVHPLDVALPFGHIEQEAHVERTYFDADGRPVWFHDETWARQDDGTIDHTRRQMRFAEGSQSDLAREAGMKLIYHPSGGQLAFMEVVEETRFGIGDLMGEDAPGTLSADAVTDHRGTLLFRTGNSAMELLVTGETDRCPGCQGGHRFDLPLRLTDPAVPEDHNRYPRFEWYTPGWPTSVGMYMHYYDAATEERFLEVHVVPRHFDSGDGDAVSIRWFDLFPKRSTWVLPRGDPEVPLTPLGEVLTDDRPLYRSIGFDTLRAAVRGEETASGLRRWAEDAQPVEFYWIADPPVLKVTGDESDGFLPLPGPAKEEVIQYPSRWFLTLARPDGELRSVEVRLVEEKGAVDVISVRDVCDAKRDDESDPFMYCAPVEPERVSPDRAVIDPWHLIEKAEKDAARHGAGLDLPDGPLRQFAYASLLHMDTDVGRRYSWAKTDVRMQVLGSYYPGWVDAGNDDDLLDGVAYYRQPAAGGGSVSGSFDLRDAAILDQRVHHEDVAPPRNVDTGVATLSGASLLVPLDVFPESAVAGGILLIGLSALLRFLSWFKAGGALPVFAALYAKIKKDDVLQNERRDQIMELVRSDPGVTASDVARRLGYGWGATVHHLETLVRNGFLTGIATGAKRHYFTLEEGTRYTRILAAARRDETAALFLDAVAARPGATLKDLATILDRKVSGLSRTGSRLAKEGLLRKERDGMSVRFWPIEMASAASEGTRPASVAAES